MKVTINGGHYPGLDSGAVGASGLQEANVAKDVANRVIDILSSIGYETLFVQENQLHQITKASNEFNSDIFVSIHCNAAENTSAQGTETFCYHLLGNSEKLANAIQSQIINSLGTVDRGIKTGNFAVVRDTDCPAVLVELAFISNEEDEALLSDSDKLDEFAKAIARGITDYESQL